MYNIFSFLQDSTRKHPDKVYVVDKEKEFTYLDIYYKSITLAGLMHESGVENGDRILIYIDNSAEYISAFFVALSTKFLISFAASALLLARFLTS